jgi:transcriptional regulator with XRE-family HTH domain
MRNSDLIWAADSFGEVIRRAREAAGLNQRELAKACRTISPMYVSQIEKGTGGRLPSVKVCRLLANVLNLDEQKLLLLRHQSKAPKEIKDLLSREKSEPNGLKIDNRFRQLLSVVNQLPSEKRNQIAKVWEDALKLLEV